MYKLTELYTLLKLKGAHPGHDYVYFIAIGSGEPHTVTEAVDEQNTETLIVSGNKPGGPIHRFTEVQACLDHIATL